MQTWQTRSCALLAALADIEPLLAMLGALTVARAASRAAVPGLRREVGARLLAHTGPPCAERTAVERVVDGDTLVVSAGRFVRMLSVDAPETVNPNLTGPQALGQQARERLDELVAGRTVALERDVTDTDHYGRLLRHVWVGGRLVAEILVREGLAYAMPTPPALNYERRIRADAASARAAG